MCCQRMDVCHLSDIKIYVSCSSFVCFLSNHSKLLHELSPFILLGIGEGKQSKGYNHPSFDLSVFLFNMTSFGQSVTCRKCPCLITSPSSVRWYVSISGSLCALIEEGYGVSASCGGIWILYNHHRIAHMLARMVTSQTELIPCGISMDKGSSRAEFLVAAASLCCVSSPSLASPVGTSRFPRKHTEELLDRCVC